MVPCVRSAAGEDACGAPRDDWTDTEVAAATFADARLHRRFAGLLRQLAAGVGTTIPQACGDWAGAKAAYRFLPNGRVGEADILGGHLAATAERFRASRGVVLILQDTTEFTTGVPPRPRSASPRASTAAATRRAGGGTTRFAASSCTPASPSPGTACRSG